jgi:hypothetical protein
MKRKDESVRRLVWLVRPWAAGLLVMMVGAAACTASSARSPQGGQSGGQLEASRLTPSSGGQALADPALADPALSQAVGASPTPTISTPTGAYALSRSSVTDGAFAAPSTAQAAATDVAATAPAGTGPNVWAVLIGIQNYDAPTHHTYSGDGDTAVFANLLQRNGWPANHILQLVDGSATLANIRSAMRWLVGQSSPGSFTLFHYSGHVCISSAGGCPSGHTYLWSVDNGFMSENEFGQTMRGLQGRAWVDISGCESAAFDQGVSSAQRLYTSAAGVREKGYEVPDWHESVWTGLAVDQGMLQGRAAPNGNPSIQQAVSWAQPQATNLTQNQRPYGPQHPYAAGGSGNWYLTASAPRTAPQPPPPPGSGSGGGKPSNNSKPPSTPPTTNKCGPLTLGLVHC